MESELPRTTCLGYTFAEIPHTDHTLHLEPLIGPHSHTTHPYQESVPISPKYTNAGTDKSTLKHLNKKVIYRTYPGGAEPDNNKKPAPQHHNNNKNVGRE